MQFDCGARDNVVTLDGREFHPYYGCDRVALVQLEYQANFPYARRLAESAGIAASIGHNVRWVAFFDAGRAWIEPAARAGRPGGDTDFSADAGLGLRLGPLGLYFAVPLSGRGQDLNFFVRLGPRI
jgi:outer membrane protein assembly factor BamA